MAGRAASHRANRDIEWSGNTTKPLKSLGNIFRGVPGWGGFDINVFHDKVRHLVFGGEVVINLGDAWCTRITDCDFVDVLLRLVLRAYGAMATIFNEVSLEK